MEENYTEELKTAFINYMQSSGVSVVVFGALIRCLLISFGALAIVFVVGRYLDFVKSAKAKNAVGLIVMAILTVIVQIRFDYMVIFQEPNKFGIQEIFIFGFSWFFYWAASVLVYMAFCWKFYDRVYAAIEKKFPSRVTRKKNAKK